MAETIVKAKKKTTKKRKIAPITKVITNEVKTNLIVQPAKEQHECSFRWCSNKLGATAVGGKYCSHTCLMFERAGQHKRKTAKDKEDGYRAEYSNELFFQYIQQCELSHNPKLVIEEKQMIPIKATMIPSIEGYAFFLSVDRRQLRRWATYYQEFYATMQRLKEIQKMYLINNGLTGNYNPIMTKFMLINNHGMIDRKDNNNINTNYVGVVKDVYEMADKQQAQQALEGPSEEEDEDDPI